MNDDPKKKPKDNTVFGLPGSPPTGGSGDMKQASPQKSDKPPAAPADSPFVVNPQRRSSYPPPKFTGPTPAIGAKPIPPAAAKPPVPVTPGPPGTPAQKLAAKTILGMPVMAPVAKPGQAAPVPAAKPAPPGAFAKPATPQPVTDGTFRTPPKAPTGQETPHGPAFKAEKEGFAPTMMAYMPGPIQGPPQPQPVTTGALKRPSKPPPPPPYQQQQPQAAYQPPQPPPAEPAPVVPVVGPAAGFQPEPYQTPAQSPYQVPVVSQDNYTPPEEQYGPDYGSAGAQAQGGAPQPYQAAPYQGGGQPPQQWQPPPQSPGAPGGYPPYGGGPGAPGGMPPAGAPPQQPKKKKNPLIFVGIGCGALLILGIIITVIVVACSMCAAKGVSSTTNPFLSAQLEEVQKQCDAQIETIKKDSNISSDQKDQMIKDIKKGCDLTIEQTKKALTL